MLMIFRIMSGKNNVDKRIWFSTVGEEREDGARTNVKEFKIGRRVRA